MGKGSSKAPQAPDPYKTASTEAQFNRVDTYGPGGGGTRYGYTDANGKFVAGVAPQGFQSAVTTVESDLDKRLRQALEPASEALVGRVITDNINGMPAAARVQDRGNVAQSIFDRSFSLMAPAIAKGQDRLLTNLQARGIPVGGAAFNDAYGAQVRETQDTISRLAQDADAAAGQEQSRQFGLDSAARGNAISELVAAMGGGYNPPSNAPSGAASGVNYGGLVGQKYQADLANWQQNQQQRSQTAGALGSLGGALLMKCSRSLKDVSGSFHPAAAQDMIALLPFSVWRYRDGEDRDTHVGPMAEDWQAITSLGDGKTISVIDAVGVLMAALQGALERIDMLERRQYASEVH